MVLTANKTVLSSLWKAAEKTESKGGSFILKRKRPKYEERRECETEALLANTLTPVSFLKAPCEKCYLCITTTTKPPAKSNSEYPTTLEGCLVCSTLTTESCEIWKQVTENILLFISPKLRM